MKALQATLLVLALCSAGPVAAHGDWPPQHGGQMNEGGETSFELVARGRELTLHVSDHGTPVLTQGARGVLTITRGERSWTSDIQAAGGNRLAARLVRPLAKDDKVLARVTMPAGNIAAGRFVVR